MNRKLMITFALAFALATATALADSSGTTTTIRRPCQQVRQACLGAGFVKGAWKQGNGLWRDCINPVMQGQPNGTSKALPSVGSDVIAACKAKHPKFGSRRVGSNK